MNHACQRPARLRRSAALRTLVREVRFQPSDLIMPLFFKLGSGTETVDAMPGVEKMSEDVLLRKIETLEKSGVGAVLLFGEAKAKDASGSASYDEASPFHRAIRKIKASSDMVVTTDVCLCAYTDHGHCGILKSGEAKTKNPKSNLKKKGSADSMLDYEKTLETLAQIAVSYAAAGADIVAPSAMTDGQVRAIRAGLDKNGFTETAIMSYSAKYASSFYGPFREIAGSHPSFGDRKSYQMDYGNQREAVREALLDVDEGADIVMVKPALCFLDVIRAVRRKVMVPVAAYNVSGEYAMVKAAAQKGWLDERNAVLEILTSIKRAGADILITYWAEEAVKWLKR